MACCCWFFLWLHGIHVPGTQVQSSELHRLLYFPLIFLSNKVQSNINPINIRIHVDANSQQFELDIFDQFTCFSGYSMFIIWTTKGLFCGIDLKRKETTHTIHESRMFPQSQLKTYFWHSVWKLKVQRMFWYNSK